MSIPKTTAGLVKCPVCNAFGDPTDWLPPPGHDPMMRQFRCKSCLAYFYFTAKDGEQLYNIESKVDALREAEELLSAEGESSIKVS